jgi:hypothetical protein
VFGWFWVGMEGVREGRVDFGSQVCKTAVMEIWQAAYVRGRCVCLVLCVASMLLVGALEVEVGVHVTRLPHQTMNAKSCAVFQLIDNNSSTDFNATVPSC